MHKEKVDEIAQECRKGLKDNIHDETYNKRRDRKLTTHMGHTGEFFYINDNY